MRQRYDFNYILSEVIRRIENQRNKKYNIFNQKSAESEISCKISFKKSHLHMVAERTQ